MDYRSGMGAARDEGLTQGIAIGDARGFERARLEYEQTRLETGRSMKADGFSTEQIVKYTGLAPEIIAKL